MWGPQEMLKRWPGCRLQLVFWDRPKDESGGPCLECFVNVFSLLTCFPGLPGRYIPSECLMVLEAGTMEYQLGKEG